jgi:hypothetical protein
MTVSAVYIFFNSSRSEYTARLLVWFCNPIQHIFISIYIYPNKILALNYLVNP